MENKLQNFRHQFAQSFNLTDLQELVFDLEIDWDELAGDTLSAKIRSLIIFAAHHERLPQLIIHLSQTRPHLNWPAAAELSKSLASSSKPFQPTPTLPDTPRQNLISNMRQTWIEGILHHAIHDDIHLVLNKNFQRSAVSRFNNLKLLPSDESISSETSIQDIYEQHGRSMLVLGAPASGKTITLIKLAQGLLELAQEDQDRPIPVVLNLSSWATNRSALNEWIVEELFIDHQMARPISQQWLENNELTLLLDGLDEVATDDRDMCVAAINKFKEKYPANIVVCSRLTDYENLKAQLNLNIAICLQPLSPTQINDYLMQFGDALALLRRILPDDKALQELAKSPLMLSLMALAYGDNFPQLPATANIDDKRQHLFATYVQRVFTHRPISQNSLYSQFEALNWLTNLAHGMVQHNHSIFHIERLQSTWLPKLRQNRWHYRFFTGTILGLLPGILVSLFYIVFFGKPSGVLSGVLFGLSFGLVFMFNKKFHFKHLNQMQQRRQKRKIITYWLWFGLLWGIFNGFVDWWISLGSVGKQVGWLVLGFIFSLLEWLPDFMGSWLLQKLVLGLLDELYFGLLGWFILGIFGWLLIGLLDVILKGRIISLIGRFAIDTYQRFINYQQREINVIEEIYWKFPSAQDWLKSVGKGILLGGGIISAIIIIILIAWLLIIGRNFNIVIVFFDSYLTDSEFLNTIGLIVLVGGLGGGLISGMQTFISIKESSKNLSPNQGIKAALRNMSRTGTVVAFIIGVISFCLAILLDFILNLPSAEEAYTPNWIFILFIAVPATVILGLALGPLSYGGITFLRHYRLRYRLKRQGVLPYGISDRKLIAFFDDMVDHLILRRVGGGWIFIHRYLLEYFAAQHIKVGEKYPDLFLKAEHN